MKCKLFSSKEIQKLEEKNKAWFKENPDIKIIHFDQSIQFLTE